MSNPREVEIAFAEFLRLKALFEKKNPLNDGRVWIMKDGKLAAEFVEDCEEHT